MIQLTEKAAKYAAEKSNEVIANALAKAYEEGYRDGYKDREEEIPIDLRDNKTEYVDLGLPSGTLWAKDYEKVDGMFIYLPFGKAKDYLLPTEEQWYELEQSCRWDFREINHRRAYYCIGPNGNHIAFEETSYHKHETFVFEGVKHSYFWVNNKVEEAKNAAHIFYSWNSYGKYETRDLVNMFSGYELPIRLVKTK